MVVAAHQVTRALPLTWLRAPLVALAEARGHVLPLAAMAQAVGVGAWFAWPSEPGRLLYAAVLALAAAGLVLMVTAPETGRAPGALLLALALGFIGAGARAWWQQAPMLGFRYYGPVEGRIVEIDRSGSDALRLTLDRVVLRDMAPGATPRKVRVSLHGRQPWLVPSPGQVVILTAHLDAPQGPAEPGGFDFRRMAWFDRLGAIGYTATPVLLLEAPGWYDQWIGQLRMRLSARIRAEIPGEAGAFAAGAMTGDRSGISQATVAALRDSSLAHILAISGMNMAFLIGFVFALFRGGIACLPWLALRVNAKKGAAVLSFFVALFYLLLSGANVATERAFLMITVVLGAVLLDRRALTLRTAALAGALLLALRPESLLEPGFQMSFAATLALIAGFGALDRLMAAMPWPRIARPLLTLVASSAIGGLATAPYAAAHFNRFADLGLLANLLTVPVMGVLIMPMGALAVLAAPFGLAWLPLWLMGLGSEWTLLVAYRVAAMEGAVTSVAAPAGWGLPAFTLGAGWLVFWPGRARLAGLVPMALALALWGAGGRPGLLVSADGRLAGLMGAEGRALSRAGGGGFVARNWLENDGDLAAPEQAALRAGFSGPKAAQRFTFAGIPGVILSGETGAAGLAQACAAARLVIMDRPAANPPPGCLPVDGAFLARTGALAITAGPAGPVVTASHGRGRIWEEPASGAEDLERLGAILAAPSQ